MESDTRRIRFYLLFPKRVLGALLFDGVIEDGSGVES